MWKTVNSFKHLVFTCFDNSLRTKMFKEAALEILSTSVADISPEICNKELCYTENKNKEYAIQLKCR